MSWPYFALWIAPALTTASVAAATYRQLTVFRPKGRLYDAARMPPDTTFPPRGAALLLGLVSALLLFRLGAPPLVGPDEPRYARVAVEMQRAGAWVVPMLQGRPWMEKPPLYYWL